MERKKSKEADLERKVWVFRSLGLILVAAVVLMAFTYKVANPEEKQLVLEDNNMDTEIILDIPPEQPEPPPEPEQAPPPIIEDIEVVEDEEEIEEINFDMSEEIEAPPPVVEEEEIKAEPIVDFAEVEPEFPGGEGEMMKWIQKNIEYPPLSIEMGEQGIVYVQFVVNKDGSIEQVKVMRGVSDGLDKEAVRVVREMPKWKPGEQAGKKVRVRYTLPIHFRLG